MYPQVGSDNNNVYDGQQQQQQQTQYIPPYNPAMVQQPEQTPTPNPTQSTPLIEDQTVSTDVKCSLMSRKYEVRVGKWVKEAWHFYKDHWLSMVGFTILIFLIQFIPYVGALIAAPLNFGFFIAVCHYIRHGSCFRGGHLFHGYYYFFPLFFISIILSFLILIGLCFFIIPGLYLMITLSFSTYVYLEYHDQGIGIWDSIVISRKVSHKHFCGIFWLMCVQFLLVLVGVLLLGVGLLVFFPWALLTTAFAFKDIFGINENKEECMGCVCC